MYLSPIDTKKELEMMTTTLLLTITGFGTGILGFLIGRSISYFKLTWPQDN